MTTFSLNPTYYQVTWTLNSPTDYSSLSGDQSGGLDSTTALNYNRLVSVTGTQDLSGSPLNIGDYFIVNGYTIGFNGSDAIDSIIQKINLASKFTGVAANQNVVANYLTLTNAPGHEGQAFWIQDSTVNTLSDLGLTAGTYDAYPSLVGTSFTNVGTGSNVMINGVNVVFAAGAVSSAVSQLNAYTSQTSVSALQAAGNVQLNSINGQPFAINGGTAVSNLGITTGNFGGYPTMIDLSQSKERANMRWVQAINELESFGTPVFVGNISVTGNTNGNAAPTTFSFTIGYEHPDQIVTAARSTEPDYGNTFIGTDAIARAVARALTSTMVSNRKVFDPTIQSYGANANRANQIRIQTLTSAALDTVSNITTVETNISVTQISGI